MIRVLLQPLHPTHTGNCCMPSCTQTLSSRNLINATHPLTHDHNQVLACSVRRLAGDIHHGSQFEPLGDEEAQI